MIKKEKDLKIHNILLILQGLIEDTEKKGTAGVLSHSSILKNKIVGLNIINDIKFRSIGHEMESSFSLTVYGNVTIWDLKILLAKRLKIIPELIKITIGSIQSAPVNNHNVHGPQNINNYKVLTESDHGKTLNELKIKNQEKITLFKSDVIENIPKACLLLNGDLTEKAKLAFKEIFDFYSENGKMSKIECAKFATRATGSSHTISTNDNKVVNMFLLYDKNKDDYIEYEGFLQFFKDALEKNKSQVVWDNLSCFHFRNDLKKIMEPIDDYNSNKEIMPRFVIAKNQEYFEEIFSLQDESSSIAKESSKFLSHICTNPNIYRNILSLSNVTGSNKDNNTEVWEEYLNINNPYK